MGRLSIISSNDLFEYYLEGHNNNGILRNRFEYYANNILKEKVEYFKEEQIMNKNKYSKDEKIIYSENYNEETKKLDKTEYFYTNENRLEKIVITEKNYIAERCFDENSKIKSQRMINK